MSILGLTNSKKPNSFDPEIKNKAKSRAYSKAFLVLEEVKAVL